MRHCSTTLILLGLLAVSACAQDIPVTSEPPPAREAKQTAPASVKLPPDRRKFAVVITGIGGEEIYVEKFGGWKDKLRQALVNRLGFAEDQVFSLTEKPDEDEQRATAETVRQTLTKLRGLIGADHQLFIFFIGHGSFDGKIAKFNLSGPDLSANDYSQMIDEIKARLVVVVNMASASGEFVKPLSGKGRIVITATKSGMEQNAPKFAEHFIASLGNPEADADKNGRVSTLESFNYAVKLTGDSFKQAGKLVTEHALIDDNGDGVGHPGAEAGDGALAKTTYLDSLPQQQAGGDLELAKLFEERMRLEGEIEQLKVRKAEMKPEDYEAALEKMLIDLARLSRDIRARQKK
ncbi:MAG: hypothetical protein IPM66_05120 [Acidobacteriota bacterium]|nr:MAG: hypothetical protein IPM66_05120 [Acidobacteriota bacterium]